MPKIQLPPKLQRVLTTKARFIVLIGGRGSGKSESVARLLLMKAQTERADVLCGREYQNSIDDSVHKLLCGLIETTNAQGFNTTEKKVDCVGGGGFRYKGFARNSAAVKSAQGFKYSWIEEAQDLSADSIRDLLPTIRANNSKLFFTANPQSSADPFSQRFIVPYLTDLKAKGFYEDDMHLIIMINWRDNPWHGELEQQRQWDFKHLSRAEYDHIWEGAFNDSVENALVMSEWFDSCIDAHKKLGFDPIGARLAAHDPSDIGPDDKGYAFRHGSVLLHLEEKREGDVNEGGDWATGLAINHGADFYTWDCDGLGVGLNAQTVKAFEGKHTVVSMFKGSEGVEDPDDYYEPVDSSNVENQKTNRQVIKNRRAQNYLRLRDRMLRTHKAITEGKYIDPETLISFDSSIGLLSKLRSEVCRMPIKPNANGLFELYTKEKMKSKFKFNSPNLADSVMMLMRQPEKAVNPVNINFASEF